MRYSQLVGQLNTHTVGSVTDSTTIFGRLIQQRDDGVVFVDRQETSYSSLDEASNNIKQQVLREQLQAEIQQQQYNELSNSKIASIIQQYHNNIKITDTLIESYVELASSKCFTTDRVAYDIRQLNKLDRLVDNKIDYQLTDGTIVAISEQTYHTINNIFGSHPDIIEHMRKDCSTFLSVVNELGV